jgi:2',3'-cyclic-nucleotide 2'-phosphodiesterase (5'-nucleotidase family)
MLQTKFFYLLILISSFLFLLSCKDNGNDNSGTTPTDTESLTIFFFNDPHGQIDHFDEIQHIVEKESEETPTLLVCAGDIFSGNPIVDQHDQKGYPIVDLMNRAGVDVTVIGNHEFDYGTDILKARIEESQFEWICANVNTSESVLPDILPYVTLNANDIPVTFLGLVETGGKPNDIIPLTHPWRVTDLTFEHYYNMVGNYRNLKEQESAKLYVALTHLGSNADRQLAEDNNWFDLIIGGHSHEQINEKVNGTPVLQASSYLRLLGKIELELNGAELHDYKVSFIDLEDYPQQNNELTARIEAYQSNPKFSEVVGHANSHHNRDEVGCFYTTALKNYMQTDVSIQNGGGVRSDIEQGEVTTMDIYHVDPFNNGSVIFTMTVKELQDFFKETGAGMHISGIDFVQNGRELDFYDEEGRLLLPDETITVGMNDYIPAVYDEYFVVEKAEIQELTTAETLIQYLKTKDAHIDFEGCRRYFRFETE